MLMKVFDHIANAYRNYARFSGTATRAEYWSFQIYFIVVFLLLVTLIGLLAIVFAVGSLLPMFALGNRRFASAGMPKGLYPGLVVLGLILSGSNERLYGTVLEIAIAVIASLPAKVDASAVTRYQPIDESAVSTTAQYCSACGKVRLPGQSVCQGCGQAF